MENLKFIKKNMKIQILSDTHTFDYDIADEAEVVVHAGDFSNNLRGCLEFVDVCKSLNKQPIFVLGNHDYYGSVLNDAIDFLKKQKLNFLHWDNSIEINGYTFVGGTLFTNFRFNNFTFENLNTHEYYKFLAQNNIYDFISVRSDVNTFITPDEYVTMFNKTFNNIKKYKDKDKVVVVTHFPPSVACCDPQFDGSLLNPYFINNIDVTGYKLWLCGHTHSAIDTTHNGCRMVINPYGYPYEHDKNGFTPNKIINLAEVFK